MVSNDDEIDVELEDGYVVYMPTTHSSYSSAQTFPNSALPLVLLSFGNLSYQILLRCIGTVMLLKLKIIK